MIHTFVIDSITHHTLVRGKAAAPVLLFVQAGPGFPLIHEADALERTLHLEQNFRVVYWDQRGTGRSFDPRDTGTLSIERLVDDLSALVEALCRTLDVTALDVIGLSLGGSLATLAATRPGHRIRSVLAVGPDIDIDESERFAWSFARDEATRRGHRRALRELDAIGQPPHDTAERFMTRVKWVTNFGGIVVGASFRGLFLRLVRRLILSPHYSLRQLVGALRGMLATQARVLSSLSHFSLPARVGRLEVPLTLAQGRLDAAAPPSLAQSFIDQLDAPAGKRLVWFDACAHSPHVEAPDAFRALVLETFRPATF